MGTDRLDAACAAATDGAQCPGASGGPDGEAALLLGLSVRQVRRLRRTYRIRGPGALVHANRGRPSPRRVADAVRDRVVALAHTTYVGVNVQHLTELLAERDALRLSRPMPQ